MVLEKDIRQKLSQLAAGRVEPWAFYEWLEDASLDMHLDSAAEAVELVNGIKMLYAEYDFRDISKSDLRNRLGAYIHHVTISNRPARASISISPLQFWSVPGRSVLAEANV